MNATKKFSIDDDGYFGVTFLDMGTYGAHLMDNRVVNTIDVSNLHFDDAVAYYHADKRALSIEGDASTISTPGFALKSLEGYARIAREMDELAKPWAS